MSIRGQGPSGVAHLVRPSWRRTRVVSGERWFPRFLCIDCMAIYKTPPRSAHWHGLIYGHRVKGVL